MTRPLAADWKAAVFAMVMTHVWDDHGVTSNEVCAFLSPPLERMNGQITDHSGTHPPVVSQRTGPHPS